MARPAAPLSEHAEPYGLGGGQASKYSSRKSYESLDTVVHPSVLPLALFHAFPCTTAHHCLMMFQLIYLLIRFLTRAVASPATTVIVVPPVAPEFTRLAKPWLRSTDLGDLAQWEKWHCQSISVKFVISLWLAVDPLSESPVPVKSIALFLLCCSFFWLCLVGS